MRTDDSVTEGFLSETVNDKWQYLTHSSAALAMLFDGSQD